MLTALLIATIIFIVSVIIGCIYSTESYGASLLALTFGGMVVSLMVLIPFTINYNEPLYQDAKYQLCIQNDIIYFNEYNITDNVSQGYQVINIPTHYYFKRDWVNSSGYCGSIIVVQADINTKINERTRSKVETHIVSGTMECDK